MSWTWEGSLENAARAVVQTADNDPQKGTAVKGFKDFVMRGNLVELAVAFVIGGAFATVVAAFTAMFMDILGKLGGTPNFSDYKPGGVSVGAFLTAVIAFLIVAFVVYFFVVKPYTAAQARFFPKEPAAETIDPNTELLKEIRDELRASRGNP